MSFPSRSARSPSASLELFSRNLSLSAGTFFIQQAGGPVNGYVATGGTHLAKLGGLVLGLGVGQADAQASFARLIATPSLATLSAARHFDADRAGRSGKRAQVALRTSDRA